VPEGKRPLGSPRSKWEANIRIDLREIWWELVDCMHLAQDRDQWHSCEHSNEPSGSKQGGEFLDQLSDC